MPNDLTTLSKEAVTREEIVALAPYSLSDRDKNEFLLSIIKEQLKVARCNNTHIDNYFNKCGIDINAIQRLEEIPYIPVQMFKEFDLKICPEQEIVKILNSSGTTGGIPSKIPLDKATTLNQIKALKSILADYLGNKRRIFLVIDHEGINKPEMAFSARTAGVRGLSIYAKNLLSPERRKRETFPESSYY